VLEENVMYSDVFMNDSQINNQPVLWVTDFKLQQVSTDVILENNDWYTYTIT